MSHFTYPDLVLFHDRVAKVDLVIKDRFDCSESPGGLYRPFKERK